MSLTRITLSVDNIVRLYELCWGDEPRSIGTLATAVEMHGIYGLDQFGRVVKFSAVEKEGINSQGIKVLSPAPVLEALAAEYELRLKDNLSSKHVHLVRALRTTQAPELYDQHNGAILRYFWLKSELPDFDAIERGQDPSAADQVLETDPEKPGTVSKRRYNNALKVIGALLEFGSGELTGVRHPHWTVKSRYLDDTPPTNWTTNDLGPGDTNDHLPLRGHLRDALAGTAQGFGDDTLRQLLDDALEELNRHRP
jgi:hypothetical protein